MLYILGQIAKTNIQPQAKIEKAQDLLKYGRVKQFSG
jgi:hypothetical protein